MKKHLTNTFAKYPFILYYKYMKNYINIIQYLRNPFNAFVCANEYLVTNMMFTIRTKIYG